MRWIMSNKPCEALRIRQIRSQCRRLPRWSAYLWSGMVKPRSCEVESVFEGSKSQNTLKRQYRVEMEGNWKVLRIPVKSEIHLHKCLWLVGYKSCTSIGGATGERIGDQINKDSYPETGCSGDLNLTDTVHPVNVGTSYLGRKTGLAATEVGYEGREIRSSLSQIRSGTWRRNLASCSLKGM
jgi:hypothetical protein